jgi:stage II sporulation protein D
MINLKRILTIVISIVYVFLFSVSSIYAQNETNPQPWIRVVILTEGTHVSISATGSSYVNRLLTTETIQSFDAAHTYSFDLAGDQVRLNENSGITSDGFSIILNDNSGRLTCNGRSYRRIMRVQIWEGKLISVNVLQIEEYIWGVVPCEVPSDWATEALRAQAIAARTYALRALMQYPDRPFDVYSSVVDQVYHGAGSEAAITTTACNDTAGIVCTYEGLPIIAYYHAASGGWTASGTEMFGRDLPYLRAVPSRDSSINRWTYRISTSSLASSLRNNGFDVGTIQRVFVHRFSPEGRAEEVKIIHSSGVLIISGAELRSALGAENLESTYFTVEGQDAPAIPDGTGPQPAISNGAVELHSMVNPQIFVPYPVVSTLETYVIASSDTTSSSGTLTVIGADGEFHYTAGSIWIAEPVRVLELAQNRIDGFSFFVGAQDSRDIINAYETTTIEDPGDGVGNPSNGNIVFVGHGSGHGVGMSQHGARIFAENGWTCDMILKYFYTGIDVVRLW